MKSKRPDLQVGEPVSYKPWDPPFDIRYGVVTAIRLHIKEDEWKVRVMFACAPGRLSKEQWIKAEYLTRREQK